MEVVPLSVTYGSDHFAYNFDAALTAAQEEARKREHDRERLQDLAEAEHTSRLCAGELSRTVTYGYGRPTMSKPAGKVIDLQPPTRLTLEHHREKFTPTGQGFAKARELHRKAVDEVAAAYGLTADTLSVMVKDLRGAGRDVPGIADELGVSERKVKALLAA